MKDGILKARCESALETEYNNYALARGVDTADIVREALRDFYRRVICAEYAQRTTGRPD